MLHENFNETIVLSAMINGAPVHVSVRMQILRATGFWHSELDLDDDDSRNTWITLHSGLDEYYLRYNAASNSFVLDEESIIPHKKMTDNSDIWLSRPTKSEKATLSSVVAGNVVRAMGKWNLFSYVPKRMNLMHGKYLTWGCVTVLGWYEKVVLGLPVCWPGLSTCFLCHAELYSPPNMWYSMTPRPPPPPLHTHLLMSQFPSSACFAQGVMVRNPCFTTCCPEA